MLIRKNEMTRMEKQIKSSGFTYNETEISSSYYQRSEKKISVMNQVFHLPGTHVENSIHFRLLTLHFCRIML